MNGASLRFQKESFSNRIEAQTMTHKWKDLLTGISKRHLWVRKKTIKSRLYRDLSVFVGPERKSSIGLHSRATKFRVSDRGILTNRNAQKAPLPMSPQYILSSTNSFDEQPCALDMALSRTDMQWRPAVCRADVRVRALKESSLE